jgi:hypothetical protein
MAPMPAWGKGNEKPKTGPTHRRRSVERHTLFFNLAHEAGAATSTYYLIVAGKEYRLSPMTENARLLSRARRTNRFLRAVPDHQVTHGCENVELAGGGVQLCYVKSDPDTRTGTWAMSSCSSTCRRRPDAPTGGPPASRPGRSLSAVGSTGTRRRRPWTTSWRSRR